MKDNLANVSVENLTEKLVKETVDVNVLNIVYENHRKAFSSALKLRPNLLQKVNGANEKDLFELALAENYKYFIYLPREKYTDSLVQTYLDARFNIEQKSEDYSEPFVVGKQKSLDDKLLFSYNYTTPTDAELYYFDQELQIPTSLKSSISLIVKMVQPLALVDSLDLNVSQLGLNSFKQLLSNLINPIYKAELYRYIKDNNVGFYSLNASTEAFEVEFKNKLNARLNRFGLEVKDFAINKISIPQDSRFAIEDQAIRIRKQKAEFEVETQFAKKALENYETKLSIQQKYPDVEHPLTEYEKDLALKRYLLKVGRWDEDVFNHTNSITQVLNKKDKELQKKTDVIPAEEKTASFMSKFIGYAVFFALLSFFIMLFSVSAGLTCLGIFVAIFGAVAAFNYPKFKEDNSVPQNTVVTPEENSITKTVGEKTDEQQYDSKE